MKSIAFIDTEVSTEDNKSYDFGAIDNSGKQLHTGVPHEFFSFIEKSPDTLSLTKAVTTKKTGHIFLHILFLYDIPYKYVTTV